MKSAQVAVVGGGPAGLAAAIAAARSGAATVLIDEQPEVGGQLRYRLAPIPLDVGPRRIPIRPWALRVDLVGQATRAKVDLRPGSVVWGLFAGNVLTIAEPATGISYQLRAERVILSTGSTDLPFPFAGGSLPGVFSARAIQILLHVHRVRPGRRFAILGIGPEAQEVANDVCQAGGDVVMQAKPASAAAVAAEGANGVEAIWLRDRRFAADVVVVAVGRQPDPQLAMMAECAAGYGATLGGVVPVRDEHLTTTQPGILIAGDAAGLGKVPAMVAEGTLAGLCAAAGIGLSSDQAIAAARRQLERLAPGRLAAGLAVPPLVRQGRSPLEEEAIR